MFDKQIFMLPGAKRITAWCASISVAFAALMVGQAAALAWALALLWEGKPLADAGPFLLAFALCFVGKQALHNLQSKRMDTFAAAQAETFHGNLVRCLYAGGQAKAQKIGTGAAATLCMEGIADIEQYLRSALPRTISLAAVPVLLLGAVASQDWVSALIALLVFPAIILQMVLIGSTAHDKASRQHREYQRLANHFTDSLRGIDTLKYFGQSSAQADRVFESSEKFRAATMKTLRVATLSGAVLDAFSTISLAAIAIMLGFRLVDGSVSLLPALFVLVLMPDYFRPIREFASDYHATLNGKSTLEQIRAITEEGASEAADADGTVVAKSPIEPWGNASELKLRNVSFSYDGAPALHGVSLALTGTCVYGIVGPSGCGKSTLGQILAGMLKPAEGSIEYGEQALDSLCAPSWRNQVAYLPQNPHLFSATLRHNITFYQPDATEGEIERALALTGLDALVQTLPKGLETVVGEGGRTLSGGQAQRVALARAALHRTCRVLVFDEPTAHLDIGTEYELKQRMVALMQGKLVVFATHRLHWLSEMDEVILLENGRVEAMGTPEEVCKSKAYACLANTGKAACYA